MHTRRLSGVHAASSDGRTVLFLDFDGVLHGDQIQDVSQRWLHRMKAGEFINRHRGLTVNELEQLDQMLGVAGQLGEAGGAQRG